MSNSKICINDCTSVSIIPDFLNFLDYIGSHQVKLTSRGAMQRKDLIAAYGFVQDPKPEIPVTANQLDYPALHLFFQLANGLGLLRKMSQGSARYLVLQKKNADEFKQKSTEEQYVLLLKTFWIDVDWDETQGGKHHRGPDNIDFLFQELTTYPAGEKINVNAHSDSKEMLVQFGFYLYYFEFFGLWSFERDVEKEQTQSLLRICPRNITLTSLFKRLALPLEETWVYASYDDTPSFLDPLFTNSERNEPDEDYEEKRVTEEQFYAKIVPLFAGNLNLDLGEKVKPDDQKVSAYVFKVRLRPSCWRKIQLSGSCTMEQLHMVIQSAFDFDNDHLYAFFMDGRKYGRNGIYAPMDNQGPHTPQVTIDSLHLYEGQSFMYLFDYGDEWTFAIDVVKIVPGETCDALVCESKGQAPDQYAW
ncbi:plasmid pRiA4b ORF-3 family protein [Sporolactobacillus sp. STCC-11]|uniref:plasmid pRiA4b ORF-3 family protein n=1 Tax=Sporolactobacillus caesalpiniae TaxID=3230362 RepID=UPI00339495A2